MYQGDIDAAGKTPAQPGQPEPHKYTDSDGDFYMIKHPILRYHGGKWKIAPWIINHFPPHDIYVEPFGGGGSILFRKNPCRAEIYNDLDNEIVNVFRVIRDHLQADKLAGLCLLTPYSRSELDLANEPSTDPVEQVRGRYSGRGQALGPQGQPVAAPASGHTQNQTIGIRQ